jgi:hypothetical protein
MYRQKCANFIFSAYISYFEKIKKQAYEIALLYALSVYSYLSLLGNGSVNTFPRQ